MGWKRKRKPVDDLVRLYSARLLALAADIPLTGRLAAPEASVMRRSPLCGSQVTVDVTTKDGRIAEFRQDVRACALGQAAASVVGQVILGRSEPEVRRARDELRAMLAAGGPIPAAPFEGLEALMAARDFPNRHASILLSLDATVAALEEIAAKT
ncbi:iron-sulfur cluster assembly scaffold protein [Haematobacter genomosp. 1]|uniref:Iron-sulfur cluster assembly scaffold protein n=1 Tax=Haematobacter genomosp. 1 TaxID=366618 RepID=A0A212AG24_9RHOB|nr:iron-sulfur cluster assembly scaffold protein [Haematobacter genomosp. 1]